MRASTLKATITKLYPIARTLCVEGAPGGGKTSIAQQAARELDVHYSELHMPTMLTEDFGVPNIMGDGASFNYKLPEWYPAKGSKWDDGRGGILCFDDRNQAGADLQKVMANICQARTLHGSELADGWMVMSTGNRQSDRAGANRVLSHLRNRETVIELETHLDDWSSWALENGIRPEVVAFIRFKTSLLHDFDPQREANPTPRSWAEGVSAVLDVVPKEAEYECFKGAVGEGAAAEFVGFLRIFRKLPDPDVILMNPDKAEVPTDPATLYALTGALSHRATEANFGRVCTYIDRMPPEFNVLTMTMATSRDSSLADTEEFVRWAVKHQKVLF